MILGTAQIDITPAPGVELSGFAARVQPSTGMLDPLFAKACFFAGSGIELLWVHCDLIGFDRSIVVAFREWAQATLDLPADRVMLSATHTHAGPCTIHLREAGQYDPAYAERLLGWLREAAERAMASTEPVDLVMAEGRLDLAVDRRKTASAHTDPRVAALGFRRKDGSFAAAIVNYPMHPVALGPTNRRISADISGQAAFVLQQGLPGNPVVMVTNGACANLNPPAENVPFAQVQQWGGQLAQSVLHLLKGQERRPNVRLRVDRRVVRLPLETLDAAGINAFAEKALRNAGPLAEWGDKYRRVVEHWRSTLLSNHPGATSRHEEAELFAIGFDHVILLGANAEVFSEFTDLLRRETNQHIYIVGYANGDLGYLPTRAAYAEGGYEVEVAHMFYGGFRPKAGGLELLAAEAGNLAREFAPATEPHRPRPARARVSEQRPT